MNERERREDYRRRAKAAIKMHDALKQADFHLSGTLAVGEKAPEHVVEAMRTLFAATSTKGGALALEALKLEAKVEADAEEASR